MTGVAPGIPAVLHVSWEYPPLVYGGLGRHVDDLTRAWVRAGGPCGVVTSGEDVVGRGRSAVPQEVRGGVEVARVRRDPPRAPWSALTTAVDQLGEALVEGGRRLAEQLRPQVVHAHDWMAAGAGSVLAQALQVPMVLTLHATEHGRRQGRLDGALPLAVHRREVAAVAAADRVVVCSRAMRTEAVDALGADPDRVDVVAAGVDVDRWDPSAADRARARRRWAPDAQPLVVAAGRLEWEKGFSTLLRALPGVLTAAPGTVTVLAGEGSYSPVLADLAASLGLDDAVVTPGHLGERDLAALLGAADVVVVPSRYEPFGLVALEAQAAGAAVVVTRVGGLADLVDDGRTGLVVGQGDVHALTDAVGALLADPTRRRALGTRARDVVRRERTWAATVADTARTYARAGAGPSA